MSSLRNVLCIIIVDLPLLQEILNSFGIDLQSGGMLLAVGVGLEGGRFREAPAGLVSDLVRLLAYLAAEAAAAAAFSA